MRRTLSVLALIVFAGAHVTAQANPTNPDARVVPKIDLTLMLSNFAAIADDSMEGRRAGTGGGVRAATLLIHELGRLGVQPLVERYVMPFTATSKIPEDAPEPYGNGGPFQKSLPPFRFSKVSGANILGIVQGTDHPTRYIVVSAHYDHLGASGSRIWNGANDNASGSAGILAIAQWVATNPLKNSIIFAWFDGEEEGLLGSSFFVEHSPVPLDSIIANVNLDMVSSAPNNRLFATGTHVWPVMKTFVDSVASLHLVDLRQGHDQGGRDDWVERSDMKAFNAAHIPFIHFGTEESSDYHRTSDRSERANTDFYLKSIVTAAEMIRRLDASLGAVALVRHKK